MGLTRRSPGASGLAWTAGEGTPELAALLQAGFQPVGLVTGLATEWAGGYSVGTDVVENHSAVSYVGTPRHPALLFPQGAGGDAYHEVYPCPHSPSLFHRPGYNFQDVAHEQARRTAVRQALSRLRDRAKALGGHGAVGIRLDRHTMGSALTEVSATGTAIHHPGAPGLDNPFTSGAGPQDLGKLLASGWVPVKLVAGIASIRVMEGCTTRRPSRASRELVQLSQAMAAARRLAVEDLEAQAVGLGEGIIGVQVELELDRDQEPGTSVEMLLCGTVVRSFTVPPGETAFTNVIGCGSLRGTAPTLFCLAR